MTWTDTARVEHALIAGREFALPEPWAGYEIPVNFPMKDAAARETMMVALWSLAEQLNAVAETQPAVWLLMDNLHKDDAVLNISRNGGLWRTSYGLGLWPGQPPPRMMTSADIFDIEWGTKPRLPYHRVTALGAEGEVLHSAWTTMFGLGSSVLTYSRGGGQAMLQQTRETLREPITDENFREFPFYFPMLGAKTLRTATAEQLDGWLGPAQLYLRESEEDRAILLLVRTSPPVLRRELDAAGFLIERLEPESGNVLLSDRAGG